MSDSESILTDLDCSEYDEKDTNEDGVSTAIDDLQIADSTRSISPVEAGATLFKLREFNTQFARELKDGQLQVLAESLEELRKKGNSDVILVSGEREFPAHRFFLAASCPYFNKLMQCDSKRINCDIDSEVLEIILEFIYTAEASELITEEQLKDVLYESHKMKLDLLTKYCSQALLVLLSEENFHDLWAIAHHCKLTEMTTGVLDFVMSNFDCVVSTNDFLCESTKQIKELVLYAKCKVRSLDKVLLAVLKWVQHVLVARQTVVKELFDCIDPKRVSKDCIQHLTEDDELMQSSPEISANLKEMELFVFRSRLSLDQVSECSETYSEYEGMTIAFFNEHCLEEFLDPKTKCLVTREVPNNCVQQFDLQSMSWLPLKKLCFSGFKGAAMCQYNQFICIVGGSLGPVYVMFEIYRNITEYISCSPSFNGLMDAGMCVCVNYLFVIGGLNAAGPTTAVQYTLPGNTVWHPLKSLQHARASPTVLASTSVIYVVGGTNGVSDRLIEYFDFGKENFTCWTSISIPNIPKSVQMHFFLSVEALHALYFEKGDCIQLTYFREKSKWQAERPVIDAEELKQTSRVLTFPNCSNSFICMSTQNDNFGIPDYVWEPEMEQCLKMQAPKEKCLIPDCDSVKVVYSMKRKGCNFAQGPDDGNMYEWSQNQWSPVKDITE